MAHQLDLFKDTPPTPRDLGIKKAIEHAESLHENWGEKAYRFLVAYSQKTPQFMAEDVRAAAVGSIPQPPTDRAWGGIIVRAVKSGLIKRQGYQNVKNSRAHNTPASVWAAC